LRAERRVAPLAADRAADPPDLLLLQEVAGGLVIGAESVAHLLAARLREADGPDYAVVHAPASGVEGFFSVGNVVLTRCPVLARRSIPLPEIAELSVAGGRWRLARDLLLVDVPTAAGPLHVFDTHLCAACTPSERVRQLRVVLAAVRTAAAHGAPVILGGDFNIDVVRDAGAERPLYETILRAGLHGSVGRGRGWCARPAHPDAFCTVGVADP
jgi:maltose 6'-phosphate phosphatase